MGACLCKGHQEYHNGQQHPIGELHSWAEGHPTVKGNRPPFGDPVTDSKNGSGYNIGELATSSLMGLVATIKEHITKPTAMAQGRVAHLIEWKGWGGETPMPPPAGGSWCGWGGGAGAALQEDEQLYSRLTDELKEARFAAGVAEQFALAEATLNVWPSQDIADQATTSTAPLQGNSGLYLSQILMDGGTMGIRQHLYSLHTEAGSDTASLVPSRPILPYFPNSVSQPESQGHLQEKRTSPPDDSLSEDEVFYN
uniref:Family with sequence similarity 131 member C n=1 Tax=Electrophorus electricus TaxID=8005 RepID=A0A4W4G025_ELEEL